MKKRIRSLNTNFENSSLPSSAKPFRKKIPNGIPKDKVIILKEKYRDILSLAEMEYQKHPPSKAYMDGYNLQKRMHLFQESHLNFLTHPEVDPTNNISERGLRKI